MRQDPDAQLARWEAELARLVVVDRWGETRRFNNNRRKVERRNWLINHIADAKARRKGRTE